MLRTYIDAFTRAALDAGITRLKFYGQENFERYKRYNEELFSA